MKTVEAGVPGRTGILAATLIGCTICSSSFSDTESCLHPAWWDARNVITTHTNLYINDRAPANQGQVKWFALQAYEEFNEKLPGAGNAMIQQRVDGFTDQSNYLPVNIGQLKNVAAPCYDRLVEYGLAGSYPWTGDPELSNDYAIATVGQLKDAFRFDLPTGTNLYYVATDGSDDNPGTFELPFRTIQYAVNQVLPGDTVLIRGGTYREKITLSISGTPEQPITILGYGDEYPTIKGSEVVTNWIHYRDNIWMVTNWTINSQQVFHDDVPLQQIGYPHQVFKDNPAWYNLVGLDISDMIPGSFFWNSDEARLYVWLTDGQPPPAAGLEVSTRIRPFHGGNAAHIQLDGLRFRHSAWPWGGAVILGPHSMIKNSDIQWCDFTGLFMRSHSSAINCNISNNGNSGIGGNNATNLLIRGCTITNNNYRWFDPNWHAGGIKLCPDVSATVENNIVAWNNGHGIWFDYCNENEPIKIRNNYVHHNRTGIFVEVSPGAHVYNNLLLSNAVGIYVAESSNVHVFNNTVAGSYGHAAIHSSAVYSRISSGMPFFGNRYFNNLLFDNRSTYDIILPSPTEYIWDNQSDYNCIYRSDGSPTFSGYGGTVSGLDTWQQASGQDHHSQQSHPLLLNPPFNNYDLSAESLCIDAGTSLTDPDAVPYDFAGRSRIAYGTVDMGAYEFHGFGNQIRPEIWISPSTPLLPYDLTTLTGTMNANVAGNLSALIISDGSTNRVSGTSTTRYSWELDISDFEVGQEYTVTLYGINSVGSLEQQIITVTRGDIGTGTPELAITTPAPIILDSGPAQIIGSKNLHVADWLAWSNQYNQTFVSDGTFSTGSGIWWSVDVDQLYPGQNKIHVVGTNAWGVAASDTIRVDYGNTTNHFVDIQSPNPTYPYITWDTAATTIQAAVDAASDGDTVYVTNGVYQAGWTEHETGRTQVMVDKGIRLQSVNGPAHTTIRGSKAYPWPPYTRCITLDHIDADLIGFTLSEGYANGLTYGGGALIMDMNIMSNCIVTACVSPRNGGGVYVLGKNGKGHGLMTSSSITENTAMASGGGVMFGWAGNFTMENCSIENNTATGRGGGMFIDNCRKIRNCLIVNNHSGGFGGGMVLGNNAKVYNCTIENNRALRGAGVAIDAPSGVASIYNSIFFNNDPDNFTVERIHGTKPYTVEYCSTTLLPTNLTSTAGSITNEPIYVYPYGGDYRLTGTSPGIDMGATYDWMAGSMALNHTNRSLFGQPDIGCYEFDDCEELYIPFIEPFCPTGLVSYDEHLYTAFGGKNIMVSNITATLTVGALTTNLPVNIEGMYNWSMDPVQLDPGITNLFTLTGSNAYTNKSFSCRIIRGGIGTGSPEIGVTNLLTETLPDDTVYMISGTNNIHLAGSGTWELANGIDVVMTGSLDLPHQTWLAAFTNLTAGTYRFDIRGTNLWNQTADDSLSFDVND